jgi:hypothetical protein
MDNLGFKLVVTLALSVISGILGRLGGKEGFDTKFRDIGVSACICAILGFLTQNRAIVGYLALIPVFGLQWGALTTYRYFLPKPKDYSWWHYSLHAFMICLCALPFVLVTKQYFLFGLRCLVSSALVGAWYFVAKWNDDLHEFGRYFLVTLSSYLLVL